MQVTMTLLGKDVIRHQKPHFAPKNANAAPPVVDISGGGCIHPILKDGRPSQCGKAVKKSVQHGWLCERHYWVDGPRQLKAIGEM